VEERSASDGLVVDSAMRGADRVTETVIWSRLRLPGGRPEPVCLVPAVLALQLPRVRRPWRARLRTEEGSPCGYYEACSGHCCGSSGPY
jgi:hypothetical protein